MCAALAAPALHAQTAKEFNLQTQDAASGLRTLALQGDFQVFFPAALVEGRKINSVQGRYTARDALERALRGTGLNCREAGDGTFIVQREGAAPADGGNTAAAKQERGASAQGREQTRQLRLVEMSNGAGASTADAKAQSVDTPEESTIEVTGSRIRGLLGESDFTPMLTFTRADIEHAGVTSIGELGRLIPQAYSQGSYDGIGFGGQTGGLTPTGDGSTAASLYTSRSTFNLRGLGTQNTLVLIDGRRMPTSGVTRGNDANDLAAIPVSSIERIEVLTDGASAIYGSDAVGGVINIILRKNYAGTEANVTYENTFDSDSAVRTMTLSHSTSIGKLSLSASGTYQDRNAFAARDRYFTATDNWNDLGANDPLYDLTSSIAFGGNTTGAGIVQSADFDNLPGRDSPYAVIPTGANGALRPAADYVSVQGDDFGVPSYADDRAKYVNIISPQRNRGASVRMSYDFGPRAQWFADARYSDSLTAIEGLPVSYQNYLFVPADYPGNPFGTDVFLHKTFWELGNIQGSKQAKSSSLAGGTGLRGEFGGDWRYQAGFDWGRSVLRDAHAYDPMLVADAYDEAIANEELVLFYDSRTQAPNDLNLLRSLLSPANTLDQNINMTWAATADGPVFTLPAGRVRLAAGAEHRRESAQTMQSQPEPSNVNQSLLGNFDRNVDSAYAEALVPLVAPARSLPLVHRLDATAAVRYDRYSDVGGDYSPRFGIQWRPASWLLLRGTRNDSFRAPDLQSLYRPITTYNYRVRPTDRLFDAARNEFFSGFIQRSLGGNLDLKPERATSTNVGIVLEPPFAFLDGLSLSVDFLRLEYEDRIGQATLQTILDFFPERVRRGANLPGDAPGIPGRISGIDTRSFNIARTDIRSVDYQIKYVRSTAMGHFDIRGAATVYDRYVSRPLPAAPLADTGFRYPTRYTAQAYWNRGPLGLGISGFMQEHEFSDEERASILYATAVEWNAHMSYDFGRGMGGWAGNLLSDMRLSLTVFNVFDREPPHQAGNAGFAITDPRMRRYTVSLTKTF